MIGKICNGISTLGPVGYFSAPGTTATIVSIPLVFCMRYFFPNELLYAVVVLTFLLFSFLVVRQALVYDKRFDDPVEIVLDECVGTMITFWAVPLTTQSIIVGLVVFRLLAILKIGTIREQKTVSVIAIILDDVVAAALTNILLHLVL